MVFRLALYLAFDLVGAAIGWYLARERGAFIGVLVGNFFWFLFDLYRGNRVLDWLRYGLTADAPSMLAEAPNMRGLWGEVADRTRRIVRLRDQQVVQSERRLHDFLAAIQASPSGVVLLDAKGRIEWSNQTAGEQFGIDPQRDMLQFIGNLVRDPVFAAYWTGQDFSRGIVMTGSGSSMSRPTRLAVNLHPYGEGRKLLLARDITALEQAEAMRTDFVANVSHEIRTPLTVLAGFVETLQTLPLDAEERTRYLGMMAQQSGRMQNLVSDLLTLSKLEGSPAPGVAEWTPVKSLMIQCEQEALALSSVVTASSGRKHIITFDMPEGIEIAGSHTEIHSALSNLVSNAIRYTPAGETITVRWQSLPDGRADFSVRDSGPGIAQEHISRLTERFYRVDRSRSRDTGGTGLGLAIVKHVAQRHGAELHIASELGKGSTFGITFPASRLRAAPV